VRVHVRAISTAELQPYLIGKHWARRATLAALAAPSMPPTNQMQTKGEEEAVVRAVAGSLDRWLGL